MHSSFSTPLGFLHSGDPVYLELRKTTGRHNEVTHRAGVPSTGVTEKVANFWRSSGAMVKKSIKIRDKKLLNFVGLRDAFQRCKGV